MGKQLTQDYIEGSQDMLSSIVKQLNLSLQKHNNGTPSGTVKAVSEFITYLYLKQDTIEDMQYELAKMQEFLTDEQAATLEPFGYVLKDGRIYPVYEGGM